MAAVPEVGASAEAVAAPGRARSMRKEGPEEDLGLAGEEEGEEEEKGETAGGLPVVGGGAVGGRLRWGQWPRSAAAVVGPVEQQQKGCGWGHRWQTDCAAEGPAVGDTARQQQPTRRRLKHLTKDLASDRSPFHAAAVAAALEAGEAAAVAAAVVVVGKEERRAVS